MLKIEKLLPADIPAVVEISQQQFGAHGWQTDMFVQQLDQENHFAFVAKLDGTVVAFVFVMKTFGEKGEDFNVLNIATRKGYENMGIGTEIFAFLIKLSKSLDIGLLWLEVRESNENAIKFYKNLGFCVDYVRKKYYANGENALVMSCKL
ncbi:MAG: ribosomal protein S18-alanine N-acetyltransferase [Clostridia bacterium]|nr:ribosomal protein S18-alanine N-acetyltransferase [Clostridia bacterium]